MYKKGGKQTIMREQEEAKFLSLHIEQISKENLELKQKLNDQIETTKQNKRMLSTASNLYCR